MFSLEFRDELFESEIAFDEESVPDCPLVVVVLQANNNEVRKWL